MPHLQNGYDHSIYLMGGEDQASNANIPPLRGALLAYAHLKELPVFLQKFFFFLGLHPQHIEVPRLGVESEL